MPETLKPRKPLQIAGSVKLVTQAAQAQNVTPTLQHMEVLCYNGLSANFLWNPQNDNSPKSR